MRNPSEYPLQLVHPNHRPSTRVEAMVNLQGTNVKVLESRVKDYGAFPPVTVKNPGQEEYYRSLGYIIHGEKIKVHQYEEFPLYLTHPEKEGVQVGNDTELALAISRGYVRMGKSDAEAMKSAKSSPYQPGKKTEWPKWIDGKLVEDPDAPVSPNEYPKWIVIAGHKHGGVTVSSYDEEAEYLGPDAPLSDAQVWHFLAQRRAASAADDDEAVERVEATLTAKGIAWKDKPHGTVWERVETAEPEETREMTRGEKIKAGLARKKAEAAAAA